MAIPTSTAVTPPVMLAMPAAIHSVSSLRDGDLWSSASSSSAVSDSTVGLASPLGSVSTISTASISTASPPASAAGPCVQFYGPSNMSREFILGTGLLVIYQMMSLPSPPPYMSFIGNYVLLNLFWGPWSLFTPYTKEQISFFLADKYPIPLCYWGLIYRRHPENKAVRKRLDVFGLVVNEYRTFQSDEDFRAAYPNVSWSDLVSELRLRRHEQATALANLVRIELGWQFGLVRVHAIIKRYQRAGSKGRLVYANGNRAQVNLELMSDINSFYEANAYIDTNE
ncbi:hypothetical protein BD626DRAFT_439653 [Schizophyllum amplum]|uniref:Uncharacterized protein n=1 Tax=Schizophyllum amplum TaxID=97359 RepID=A0A550BXL8_9AGAR|nr:hypothetical protein BD626DRAFT_439653 [Auriculariopsis ampla]